MFLHILYYYFKKLNDLKGIVPRDLPHLNSILLNRSKVCVTLWCFRQLAGVPAGLKSTKLVMDSLSVEKVGVQGVLTVLIPGMLSECDLSRACTVITIIMSTTLITINIIITGALWAVR